MKRIISRYDNGNYKVVIFDDGTKIRFNDKDCLIPEFPESMDMKISNYCPYNCPMCFVEGTKILMADYTYKNIEDIVEGDMVIGFDEVVKGRGNRQKLRPVKVLKTFKHVEEDFLKITTDKNTSITCTINHPIYIQRRTTSGKTNTYKRADELKTTDVLFTVPFPIKEVDRNSKEYQFGYFLGAWTGDGSVTKRVDNNGYDMYKCRFVTKNDVVNEYVYQLSKKIDDNFYQSDFKFVNEDTTYKATTCAKREVYNKMIQLYETELGKHNGLNYAAGYLAGIYDTEGHIDQRSHSIKITNTNEKYLKETMRCLTILGIPASLITIPKTKEYYKQCHNVRILGEKQWLHFLFLIKPLYDYKGFEHNYAKIRAYDNSNITSIKPITKMQYVYNFETESHTYIANNIFVHNCHEKSSDSGEYGRILNHPFVKTLHRGTELALGGGAVTYHPHLIPFLKELKQQGVLPSITINQQEWEETKINHLINEELIYGLGVSFVSFDDEVWDKILKIPNAVVHLIAGYHSPEVFEYFANKGAKILILGYKDWGRGKDYLEKHKEGIPLRISAVEEMLPILFTKCKVVSFDNLSIEQLHIRDIVGEEKWKEFYMGNDGQYTMYVDLVKGECAKSSTSPDRRPLDEFNDLWQELKAKEE